MPWKTIPTPQKKAEWRNKFLRILDNPPPEHYDYKGFERIPKPMPCKAGDVMEIYMRRNVRELPENISICALEAYGHRVIELKWECPCCGVDHNVYIPESWIAEGKAVFVEKDD